MHGFAELVLHRRPIETFAALGLTGPGGQVQHAHSLPPARINLPPLETGSHFLEQWLLRELPDQDAWRQRHYESYAPPLFVLHDVLVHSSAGIVAVGNQVIAETLAHTDPDHHGYRALAKGIGLRPTRIRRLAGVHIHLLAGNETNYCHGMLHGLARLAAVPENYQAAAAGVLVARGGARTREALALLDLMPSLAIEEVGPDDTLRVETLVLPLSVCGDRAYHPCIAEFFRAISLNVPPLARSSPRRIYIDRSASPRRNLVNEAELMQALGGLGFVHVRPESLSLADQVRLFRGADVIVAPHGAALANLGFCRPGTRVIELLMDAYCDWSYRNLAALMSLQYDCVLGLARRPWPDLDASVHRVPWRISVNHVVAAVAQTVERAAA